MNIKFSRHAKRRCSLYEIPEETVKQILETTDVYPGTQTIIRDVDGFELPLKIVAAMEDGVVTVISTYPLKKRHSQP